jgi:hypothetical protein
VYLYICSTSIDPSQPGTYGCYPRHKRTLPPAYAAETGAGAPAGATSAPVPSAAAVADSALGCAASIAPIGSGRERSMLWIPSLSMRMQLKANLTVRPGHVSGER